VAEDLEWIAFAELEQRRFRGRVGPSSSCAGGPRTSKGGWASLSDAVRPRCLSGELQDDTDSLAQQSLTLTNVTDPNLGAGNHTFGLTCDELDGDIVFDETYVSAVVLGLG
jgi:hypothetical protein